MPAVPMFSCYVLDRDNRIQSRTDIEARSLGEAIDRVREKLKTRRERLSFEIWQGARRVHPERRDDSMEEAFKRLEMQLGGLAGSVRGPRPHKGQGRPRTARLKCTPPR